jgi:sensor domain CHASE-containing protein
VYRWIVTRDPKFIADNMGSETMKGASLNLVAFMDLEGRYAWRSGFAPGSFDPLPYALLEANALPAGHPWLAAVRSGRAQRGFVMTEHGPMMLTIGPILDGNGRGPTRGAVMMGRLLTGQEIKRLAEQARVSAEVLQPGTRLRA